jgi:transcriptional regulator with XRE-family HTH domain
MGVNALDWLAEQEVCEKPEAGHLRERFEAAMNLGLQFHDARTAAGLTQKELAEQAGVRQADVSKIERGGNATAVTFHRVAVALGGRIKLVADEPGEAAVAPAAKPRVLADA